MSAARLTLCFAGSMTEDGRWFAALRGVTYPIGGHPVFRVCMHGSVEVQR